MPHRRTEDLDLISTMDKECFPNDDPPNLEDTTWWVYYEDGEAIAYCSLSIVDGNIGFLSRSGVMPGHRGKGLQKKMIRHRERVAKREKLAKIITYTFIENVYSSNNLISAGYKLYLPDEGTEDSFLHWYKYIN